MVSVDVGSIIAGTFFIAVIWLFITAAIALSILSFVFWIFMIIDVAKRKFKQNTDKVVWILVVILAGVIGAAIYYFVVKRKDKKKENKIIK